MVCASAARGQSPSSVVAFETVLDTPFHVETGTVRLSEYVIAFAPEGAMAGEAAVLDARGEVIARFPFLSEYRARSGVFGRAQVQGPAEVPLTEPGQYILAFAVGSQPVTRMAFALETATSGNDPFDTKKTYRFVGPWRKLAYLTMATYKDKPLPELSLWLGGPDLPAGAAKDTYQARLYRAGELVAHSKLDQGHIAAGHYKRTKITLYHPHERRASANAPPFMLSDWLVDGPHELRVHRGSDDAPVRSFAFEVAGGAIQPPARTKHGYQPRVDYIAPRVTRKHTNTFEMIEAVWLESP